MQWKSLRVLAMLALGACADSVPTAVESPTSPTLHVGSHSGTVVVKPGNSHGWFIAAESGTGSGSFVAGPAPAPAGSGSASLSTLVAADGHVLALAGAYGGSRLDQMQLSYSTYRQTVDAGNNLAIALQFNLDHDVTSLTDALPLGTPDGNEDFQGRLVYEPYHTSGGLVTQGAWQTWDADQGKWWRTTNATTRGTLPHPTDCVQANPCTIAEILTRWPDAGVSAAFDAIILKAGSGWGVPFTGSVDQLVIDVNGLATTFDFEPATPCTTTCYVDAVNGSDANDGETMGTAKKTIQAALLQVSAGGIVRVLPGTYNESAPGSMTTSLGAPPGGYQFGLFFGSAKPGITLLGVDATDMPITDASATLATINTNATNSFGYSGIFVEAANTTIQGVTIGPNAPSNNKTIEVVADGFTLKHSATAVPGGGAVYISEFDAPSGAVPSYHILDNRFTDATQIAISSGAGQTGPVSNREIKGNAFNLGGNLWPAISFNGAGGVPWYTKTVGGAVITGNTFASGGEQYIRARGTYQEAELDWESFWEDNTYDKGTVALVSKVPFVVQTFSYTSAPYTFTNVRRIGTMVQGEVNNAATGNTVLAKTGTYSENVTINKDALTLEGAGIGATVLQGTACGGTGIALTGNRTGITLRQLTATGYQYGITTGNIGNTVSSITIEDVSASSNCTHGVWFQAGVTTDVVFNRLTASNNNAVGGLAGRGLWVINGVKTNITVTDGTFNNNGLVGIDLSDGSATGVTITGNIVIGNGDAGIGVLGAKGPGANLVADNTLTNNGRYGIEIKIPTGSGLMNGPGSVVVRDNSISRTVAATDARDYAGIAVFRRSVGSLNADQPTGVVVTGNSVSGYHRKPVGSTGDGFGVVVEGTGHIVSKNIVSDNDIGIQIQDGNTADVQGTPYFDRGNATPSSAMINRNSITGNSGLDIRNVGAPVTDATCNWYGTATGPLPAKLSGSLTTAPWLISSDLDGACPEDVSPVVTNVAVSPNPAPYTTASYTLTATATDNVAVTAASYTVDGGGSVAFSFTAGSPVALSATLGTLTVGVHEICVTAKDAADNTSNTECTMLAVYDPTAGFVTGGGWFMSPAGAYTADAGLTGKATFGFVSKYVKGKTLPTGNTEFQFQAGGLNFSSTVYAWLVVNQAGMNAQFKGEGTLNGVPGHDFMVWARDGSPDSFRIQITDGSGTVVYDNHQSGTFGTPLGGGNIMIHIPKK